MRAYIYNSKKLISLIETKNVPNVQDKINVDDVEYVVVKKTPNVDVNNKVVYFNLKVE